MNSYAAFDIPINSDFNLAPLETVTQASVVGPPLYIRRGTVADAGLDEPTFKKALTQIKENEIWFDVPNIARFLVTNGNEATVEPYPGVDDNTLSIYILGSCMGAVLHQRDLLVLHANAIQVTDHAAILFVGDSGAGKSTSAAHFHQRGYPVLSDDVVAIDAQGGVIKGLPYIKLWQHSLEKLNISNEDLAPIRANINKFRLPLTNTYNNDAPRPLVKAVYNLKVQKHTTSGSLNLRRYTGLDRFTCLTNNAYRSDAIIGLGLKSQHLKQCSQLAQRAHIAEINRPSEHFCAPDMIDMVLDDLRAQKLV